MDKVRRQIHYEYAEKLGLSGKGITVCVLDTGVTAHYDLEHRILKYIDFTGKNIFFRTDESGHGTHVCGILAGSGKAKNGIYKGIAYNADLVVLKILDSKGKGQIEDFFAALEWIILNHKQYGIKIVNISVAISKNSSVYYEPYKQQRFRQLLYELYKNNIFVVTAAGNEGPRDNSISFLGNEKYTFCVGCHDWGYSKIHSGLCEYYSGRGKRNGYLIKPDIVAPGTEIMSCSNKNPYGYVKKSGTSMSCPIVSGIIALLCEQLKIYSVDSLGDILRKNAVPYKGPKNQQGYGMIDCKNLFGTFDG